MTENLPETSPLKVDSVTTIDELIARDSRELSDDELNAVVDYARAQYARWADEEKRAAVTGSNPKTAKGTKLGKVSIDVLEIDMSDI